MDTRKEYDHLIIDSDSIVWKIASACENTQYRYGGKTFLNKKAAALYVTGHGGRVEDIQQFSEPEPEDVVKSTTIKFIEEILSNFHSYKYTFMLGTPGCFRYDVATILPYKGSRPKGTPTHFHFVRDNIAIHYDTMFSLPALEADDEVACLNQECQNALILSIDKDLKQIPGNHYNFDTKEYSTVSYLDGIKSLACQMLTGDHTDNVLGICGLGEKSKHLVSIMECGDVGEIFKIVLTIYQQYFGTYAFQFLRESFLLLRLVSTFPTAEEKYFMDMLNIDNGYWNVK